MSGTARVCGSVGARIKELSFVAPSPGMFPSWDACRELPVRVGEVSAEALGGGADLARGDGLLEDVQHRRLHLPPRSLPTTLGCARSDT
jgi:hypothetical protein